LEELGIDVRTMSRWIIRNKGGKMWPGCIWLSIGTNGGILWTVIKSKFGFQKIQEFLDQLTDF
jgi:hypothetical protein